MSDKQYRCKAEVDADYVPERIERDTRPKGLRAWLENYWYHYKWATIISAFLIAVFIFTFIQFITRESPDYVVMTAFDRYVPSEITDVMSAELAKYGEDLNGDGKVIVDIYDVSTSDNRSIQQSNVTKMMAELQRGEIMLFIVDGTYFDKLNELEVFEKDEKLFSDCDGYAVNLRDTELTEKINSVYPNFISNDYFIAKRVVKGTSFEKVSKSVESEKQSVALLKRFIAEEKGDADA